MIDTNIAIHLRDGTEAAIARFAALAAPPAISIITLVELEGGVYRRPHLAGARRAHLDQLLLKLPVIDFTRAMSDTYRAIVSQNGFSRQRILDRMIAATAIVQDLTLVTINGADFRDITNLRLETWLDPLVQ